MIRGIRSALPLVIVAMLLIVTPVLASAIAGAPRGHRPRLLPRQDRQGDCGNRWNQRGDREDAHVLCA